MATTTPRAPAATTPRATPRARATRGRARRAARARATMDDFARDGAGTTTTTTTDEARVDGRYAWRGHDVRYERAGARDGARKHVVLLPGFGVGSFHYDAQLARGALGDDTCVWALDFVGQGRSWPSGDGDVEGFQYSVDAWREQVEYFLREVVGERAYLTGNSLGGFVATYVAAMAPELTKGLILVNATPFWAFVPSDGWGNKIAPWRGALPAPKWIRTPIKAYWESFRSAANVRGLLSLVYANPARIDDALVRQIIEPTDNVHALSTFCSVVWSPKAALSFDEMLNRIPADLPVAMVYGKDDPWVVPLWGQRLKRAIPRADYYELTPSGHCPAHETPNAFNCIAKSWLAHREDGAERPTRSSCGTARLIDGAPRNIFERLDAMRAS